MLQAELIGDTGAAAAISRPMSFVHQRLECAFPVWRWDQRPSLAPNAGAARPCRTKSDMTPTASSIQASSALTRINSSTVVGLLPGTGRRTHQIPR